MLNPDELITSDSEHIRIEGHLGTWYVIDTVDSERHGMLFLLENEDIGDDAACLIVSEDGKVILDDVWNGFLDYEEWLTN
jgi:hypothetical protein